MPVLRLAWYRFPSYDPVRLAEPLIFGESGDGDGSAAGRDCFHP